jgi:hypothetical protein
MPDDIGGVSREQWKTGEVARATSSVSCGRCGKQFPTPHDFYEHKDNGACMTRAERDRARRKGAA